MYKTVNDMLGDLVKVTPSSKMVGDFAIFMVQNALTPENIVLRGESLAFPDSVVTYFKGMMGQPAWGFPKDLQKVVLKGEEPITCRPGELLPPVDFGAARERLAQFTAEPSERDMISWFLYPKVVEEYHRHLQEYGIVTNMPSSVFFLGMNAGDTIKVDIEDGKTLIIKYRSVSDVNEDGTRDFQFELNGLRREVAVFDPAFATTVKQATMAEPDNKGHVGAPIPGMVSKLNIKPGDKVGVNDTLVVVEAMKMEINIVARIAGVVGEVLVQPGQAVKAGELMATIC